jgi:hypothetical protein
MKQTMVNLKWDTIKEEGVVFTNPEFDNTYRILQLDALQDWIYDLQKLYDSLLEDFDGENHASRT